MTIIETLSISRNDNAPAPSDRDAVSRRRFLTASAGVGASALAGRALADTLADVPAREVGPP
jgi:sulfane dehydrogenase subunit SoxC